MTCECEYDGDDVMDELDRVTQLLCCLCGNLIYDDVFKKYAPEEVIDWQRNHHNDDTKRVTEEMKSYFNENDDAIGDPERVAYLFINRAETVHPVSKWHKNWFLSLAKSIAYEILMEQTAKKKALAKLSVKEKRLLGLE